MKIPGLDSALIDLSQFQGTMIEYLERIAVGVERLVQLQEQQGWHDGPHDYHIGD